jgi:hypothetical protein
MEEVVWSTTLDSIYQIKVVRTNEYSGEISISKNGKEIKKTAVPLAYGAIFGPDLSDVMNWQNWSVAVVDGLRDEG